MGGSDKNAAKAVYFDKLKVLLDEYKSIFIVTVDNVSSQQMHKIRKALRGEAVVLMGKNTMVCTFQSLRLNMVMANNLWLDPACYQGLHHG